MQFQWTTEPDHPTGTRYVLRSAALPKGSMSPLCADDRLAVCAHQGKRRWRATFWIGYDSIYHEAGTPAKAMRLLQEELDRRSIGLFQTDDIEFVSC